MINIKSDYYFAVGNLIFMAQKGREDVQFDLVNLINWYADSEY